MRAMLQPIDLLIVLKLVVWEKRAWTYEIIGYELGVSPSSVYRSCERATQARLIAAGRIPRKAALLEFVLYGVQYVYYVKPGEPTRGMPTAHAAPPLAQHITPSNDIPVWPDPEGSIRGYAVTPLHQAAPKAAKRDPSLYELLALVDALRIGRARERKLAGDELARRLRA
jgi:hypothetical protein